MSNLVPSICTCVFRKGALTLALLFVVCMSFGQAPVIKDVSPSQGFGGQTINIKGVHFGSSVKVSFGAMNGNVLSASDQLIEVKVPHGATYDFVSVTRGSNQSTGYSPLPFLMSYGGVPGIETTDFEAQLDLPAGSGLYDLCIADFDGNGLNDIVSANSKANAITILENYSTVGNFSFVAKSMALGMTTLNVTSGDLNGDGKPEIILSEGNDGNRIVVLINGSTSGNIVFTPMEISVAGNSTKRIEIHDIDIDGKPDLVVSNQAGNKLSIIRNTTTSGSLSFDTGNIISLQVNNASSTAGLVVADFNADGKPDIITNQFLTDGGGIFMAENKSSSAGIQFGGFHQQNFSGTLVNLKAGDINGDGKPDVIATRFLSYDIIILKNESSTGGTIKFSDPVSFGTAERPWGVDLADMDGDGKEDILVATLGGSLTVEVLHNTGGAGSLSFNKIGLPVTYINRNINAGDIDGDGKPDIVFTSVDDDSQGIPASQISIIRNKNCIKPSIQEEEPLVTCVGNPIQLTTQSVTGATYEWRRDGTIDTVGANPFMDVTQSGEYTVTLINEGGACSETSLSVTVEVQSSGALPTPIITTNSPVCINGTLTLTATNVGASEYKWRGPDDFEKTGISVSLDDFQFKNSGKYYLDIYSGSCITETNTVVVEAINAPEFSISKNREGPYCEGEEVTLEVFPHDVNYSYQWYNNDGAISGVTSHSYNATTSGKYFVKITDLLNTACPIIETEVFEMKFTAPPQAKFEVPGTACINTSIDFTNKSVTDSEEVVEYIWDFGDGKNSYTNNPSHSYASSGTYTVKLTVKYTELNCEDVFTKPINVLPGLEAEIVASNESICDGESVELALSKSYTSYRWSTGDKSNKITANKAGTYSVVVTDSYGCKGTDQVTIGSFSKPDVVATADKELAAPGEEVQLHVSGLVEMLWSPESLLDDATIADPIASAETTTIFAVTGKDANGCTGSDSIEIFVQDDLIGNLLKPKNFFSPNGDDVNQVWVVERIEQFPQCGVVILDQTGNILIEEKPYLNNWDGTVRGRVLSSGVYYFVIKCDNERIVKSGSITLLK